MHLYQVLAGRVAEWRRQRYPHAQYPAIGEILEWAANPEGAKFRLRPPQVRALEAYWYLRLVEGTPHIVELYRRLFPRQSELLGALGLVHEEARSCALDYGLDALLERIRTDDELVRRLRLEALRESLTLCYPSYILALAMGAGKTVLIGAIYATEFAMAMEYPEGPFVQNALVFAPGKTIIESLRELATARYDRILPPRLYKPFAASVKITFTRDGDPDIPVVRGSLFNVVVTNTERIRIQKESIRRADLGPLFSPAREEDARAEVANRRLQAIASLPRLAVFSDEAHHTYGQSLDTGLKKVRRTVDYLADSARLVLVVNTTGTPYYQRQPLRDVVIWYGLSEGIRDGILKEVAGNIQAFSFDGQVEANLTHVVQDFFQDYGNVRLADGTPAKLAIYFPQTDDVARFRPVIEAALAAVGQPPTAILEHHTACESKADFDRFRSREPPHRVALLVDRGVEGWDVPALFACALARRLKTSNNFVLQAASRCLRQVPGNTRPARIYLSMDNREILDRQLRETYGETIADLNQTQTRSRTATIRLRRLDVPPLSVRQVVRTVVRREGPTSPLRLTRPEGGSGPERSSCPACISSTWPARSRSRRGTTRCVRRRLRSAWPWSSRRALPEGLPRMAPRSTPRRSPTPSTGSGCSSPGRSSRRRTLATWAFTTRRTTLTRTRRRASSSSSCCTSMCSPTTSRISTSPGRSRRPTRPSSLSSTRATTAAGTATRPTLLSDGGTAACSSSRSRAPSSRPRRGKTSAAPGRGRQPSPSRVARPWPSSSGSR